MTRRTLLTANRVFRIATALAPPCAGACRTGSVIVTAKLIAGHDAVGERREPGPGRSGCRRCPRSGSRSGGRHQPPGSSSGPDHGWSPRPGTPRRSRPPPSPPGRHKMRLTGTSAYLFRHHAEQSGRSGRTRADPLSATADSPTTVAPQPEPAAKIPLATPVSHGVRARAKNRSTAELT